MMTNMNKTKKILATITAATAIIAGAAVIQVPTAEVEKDGFQFQTIKSANGFRRYLSQREDHMKELTRKGEVPQTSLDKATFSIEEYENALLKRKMIDSKGGEIKEKPPKKESILNKVSFQIKKAYAYTFGKEDFESCGAIPCSFDGDGSYATGTMTLDATSKVNGADSVKCHAPAADDGCQLYETISATGDSYYQFFVFYPTGWVFGVNGYAGLYATGDGVGAPVYCNIEDYGTIRITCAGDELGYTDTGLNISTNTITRLEFRLKISATVGDVDIWLNNTVAGSPSYNGSGTLNTGSQNVTLFSAGGYHPDGVNDMFYDDFIINTSFIGTGARRRIINVE